jgi:hypothetical protein
MHCDSSKRELVLAAFMNDSVWLRFISFYYFLEVQVVAGSFIPWLQ